MRMGIKLITMVVRIIRRIKIKIQKNGENYGIYAFY